MQVQGNDQSIRMLDAEAWVEMAPSVRLRIGQFKVPVSAEFLIGLPKIIFVRRARTFDLIPRRRVGAEVDWTPELGGWRLDARLGAWNPRNQQVEDDAGTLLGGRLAASRGAWMLHLGGAGHIGPATDDGARLVPYNAPVDAAVRYDDGTWSALAEGLIILDAEADDLPFAAHAQLARRIADWQPAVAWDTARLASGLEHRAQLALNLRFAQGAILLTTQYSLVNVDAGTGHEGALQLKAAF